MNNNMGQTSSEKKYNIHPEKDFDLCNVASSKDLTGLKPFAIHSDLEEEAYGDLMEYQPQDIVTVTKNKQTMK